MAKYTMTLEDAIESLGGIENMFNFDFTWSGTPEEKSELIQGFVDHYRFDEIGQETPGRFQHFLRVEWTERMERYDQIFKAARETTIPVLGTFSRNISKRDTSTINPQTPQPDGNNYVDSLLQSNVEEEGYDGRTASDLLDDYIDRTRQLRREFYDTFFNLFMGVM